MPEHHDSCERPPGTFLIIHDVADAEHGRNKIELSPMPSDDINDPLNWSTSRKIFNLAMTLFLTVAIFSAPTIMPIFWSHMMEDMGLTLQQLNHGQAANLAGSSVGCILFVPLATKFGRRPVYVLSTAIMAAITWWIAKMKSFPELLLTNIIYGMAGSTNETIVQMTISDLFFVQHRGRANTFYFISVVLGAYLTPIPAGAQAVAQGWRMSYTSLAGALTGLLVLFIFAFEETKYIPTLEGSPVSMTTTAVHDNTNTAASDSVDTDAKAAIGKETELYSTASNSVPSPLSGVPDSYRQRMRPLTTTGESLWKLLWFPLLVCFTFPHVIFASIQWAIGMVWITLFATVNSIILSQPPYNFTPAGLGYFNVGPCIGNLIGSFYGGFLSDWVLLRLSNKNRGIYEPEMRLYVLPLPALATTAGLIMYGMSLDRGIHWIVPCIGQSMVAFGMSSAGDVAFTIVIDTYRELTGEAFVGVNFFRSAIAIIIPLVFVPWWRSMSLTQMFALCSGIAFPVMMLFVPLIIYGKRWRSGLAPRFYRLVKRKSE